MKSIEQIPTSEDEEPTEKHRRYGHSKKLMKNIDYTLDPSNYEALDFSNIQKNLAMQLQQNLAQNLSIKI